MRNKKIEKLREKVLGPSEVNLHLSNQMAIPILKIRGSEVSNLKPTLYSEHLGLCWTLDLWASHLSTPPVPTICDAAHKGTGRPEA